jgi:signal transduction histidine kinase
MSAARTTPVYLQPFSGHYFLVLFDDGELLRSRSLWDYELELPTLSPGGTELMHLAGPQDQRLLIRLAGYRKRDRDLTLAVAEDVAPIEARIARYQRWFIFGASAAVLLLLLIQRLVVRRTLRPLDRLREDVRNLAQGQAKTLDEAVPNEIRPLVRELNRLLELLGRRLERSRNALGNLAHAIKSPLNLLVQELDDARLGNHPLRPSLQTQTERIRQLTERELRRARLAGAGNPGRHFDPSEELPALIATLQHLHQHRDLEIFCTGHPRASLAVDREDLLELLGNLLDNACKWAVSRVRFGLREVQGNLEIRVEDDGKGVSSDQLARLSERGVRMDEAIDGHGLGLAISRDITRLYEGSLDFDRSPELGGLRVLARLRLPRED